MRMRIVQVSFEEWLDAVNALTRANYHMSIYELEEEISRDVWRRAHVGGILPSQFVDTSVTPVFFPKDDTDSW